MIDFPAKVEIRYRSTLFGYDYNRFCNMLAGKYSEEDRLLAEIIMLVPSSLIENIKKDKELEKLPQVEYLTSDIAIKIFNIPRLNEWDSKSKIRLKKLLLNTPKCYLDFYFSVMQSTKALQNLFPTVKPLKEVCSKCEYEETCKKPPYECELKK